MPTAARSAALTPALASAPATTACDVGPDLLGVVLDPAGPREDLPVLLLGDGDDARRPRRTAMQREEVVPWSMAATKRAVMGSGRNHGEARPRKRLAHATKPAAAIVPPGEAGLWSRAERPQGVRQRRRDVEDDRHEPCQRSRRPRRPAPHTPQLRRPVARLDPRRRHRLEARLQGRHGGRLAAHGPVRAAGGAALRRGLVEAGQHVVLLPPGDGGPGGGARLRPSGRAARAALDGERGRRADRRGHRQLPGPRRRHRRREPDEEPDHRRAERPEDPLEA